MSPAAFFGSELEQGSELMDWNFAKMQTAGAHITIGSDWGASPEPTILRYMANKLDQIGGGSTQSGAELALRMLTLNGAQAVGKDKEIGSIEVGKKANFIVVDRDLSRGEFAEAQVLRTYFEGEKVWDAALP